MTDFQGSYSTIWHHLDINFYKKAWPVTSWVNGWEWNPGGYKIESHQNNKNWKKGIPDSVKAHLKIEVWLIEPVKSNQFKDQRGCHNLRLCGYILLRTTTAPCNLTFGNQLTMEWIKVPNILLILRNSLNYASFPSLP